MARWLAVTCTALRAATHAFAANARHFQTTGFISLVSCTDFRNVESTPDPKSAVIIDSFTLLITSGVFPRLKALSARSSRSHFLERRKKPRLPSFFLVPITGDFSHREILSSTLQNGDFGFMEKIQLKCAPGTIDPFCSYTIETENQHFS